MSGGLLYAFGTLAHWLGWTLLVLAVAKLATKRGGIVHAALGAALLLSSIPVVRIDGSGFWAPLVWPSMPWTAWFAAISLIFALARAIEAFVALSKEAARNKLRTALAFGLFALLLAWLHAGSDAPVAFVRGKLWIGASSIAAVAALLALAFLVMRAVGSSAAAARFLGGAASQVALAAGAAVFSVPFAWLLVTSFKEDRDMSSPDGIVWIPRVQEEVPFLDPADPLFAFEHRGEEMQGTILNDLGGGRVRVDIFRPISIRGRTVEVRRDRLRQIPKSVPVVAGDWGGVRFRGMVVQELKDGRRQVRFTEPQALDGKSEVFMPNDLEPVRKVGLRWKNYSEALEYLPPETQRGLLYVRNTLFLVVMNVIGTLLSSTLVAYGFARLRFPGRDALFGVLLSTMMLPGAVTMLPKFLVFRTLGWVDSLRPLWVPAFFASAFNVFLFRQFFLQIPSELEDAAKIDGCSPLKTFWSVMLPQIKPALAVVAIWTFIGSWNDFMGPLIYVSSPEIMPISYAVQLYNGERSGEPGMLMAFITMAMLPVLALFAFAQRYFIEGVTLSGLGGR